ATTSPCRPTPTHLINPPPLHDALPIFITNIDAPASIYQNVESLDSTHHYLEIALRGAPPNIGGIGATLMVSAGGTRQYLYHSPRSEEHTSELQSLRHLVCRLLLEKKKH